MKLLIYSHFFAPSIGSVEMAVQSFAGGLPELHTPQGIKEFEITLVTQTAAPFALATFKQAATWSAPGAGKAKSLEV
jgi:hypothetical protein